MKYLFDLYLTDRLPLFCKVLGALNLRDQARVSMVSTMHMQAVIRYYNSYERFREILNHHFDLQECVICHSHRRDIHLENCGHCEDYICHSHNDDIHCNECMREFCNDCIESYLTTCESCLNDICVHCAQSENGYTYICNSCNMY